MRFYLGTHHPHWLAKTDAPLFLSRRWLTNRKTLPVAQGQWVLDSGGFTELSLYGEWRTSATQYAAEIARFQEEIGGLQWAAPQDWMCEPFMLEKTGHSLREHQYLTVASYRELREKTDKVIPVLQGWELDDYWRCWEYYDLAGVDLWAEPVVGLGSVCRRQDTVKVAEIVRALQPLKLHAFGAKILGLRKYADALVSADSMAWSYRARMDYPLKGCTHKSCANCLRYALRWRDRIEESLGQLTLEAA